MQAYREDMRIYAALADPANYRVTSGGTYLEIQYVPPEDVLESRASEQEAFARFNRYSALADWARRSRASGSAEGGLTVEDAITEARAFSRPDDFQGASHGEMEYLRLEAVVSVAAVAIKLDAIELQIRGHLDWCRQVVRAAAGPSVDESDPDAGVHPEGVSMTCRAVGLLGLARHGLIRPEERQAVISLARRGPPDGLGDHRRCS